MKALLKSGNLKYYLLMHAIVLAWGFTGLLGKLIQIDFFRLVFFRMIIAGLSLLIFFLLVKKKFVIRDRKALLKVIGVGIIVVLHWLTFFKAIQVSTVSLGVLCLSTTTLHVSWLEPIVMRRKFSWIEFSLSLLIICGVVFISKNIDPSQYEGLFWGLISAVLSASFAVFNAKLNKDGIAAGSITLYEMFVGAILLFIWFGLNGQVNATLFEMTRSDVLWLIFLGVVCTSMAFVLMIDIMKKIGAYAASLTINLEPVYSMFLAVIILSENQLLGNEFYFGALFIVLVVLSNPILKKMQKNYKKRRMYRTHPTL